MRGGDSPRWIARSAPRAWSGPSRRAESLASKPSMTGPRGPARRNGAGGSVTMALRVAAGQPLPKGDLPSTAAYSVAPSEKRSDAGSNSPPWTCSGAMYAGLPMILPVDVSEPSSAVEAMPKSVRTTRRPPHSCTLLGLTSRWTMPSRWVACSASRRALNKASFPVYQPVGPVDGPGRSGGIGLAGCWWCRPGGRQGQAVGCWPAAGSAGRDRPGAGLAGEPEAEHATEVEGGGA